MAFVSAAENRKLCKAKMGEELGTIYVEIYNRHTALLFQWGEYVELFGTSPGRIDLLNASAPHLSYVMQEAIWAVTVLELANLTDSPTSGRRGGKRETLTVRRLAALVAPTIRKRVARAVEDARVAVEFARDWRNRTLAHLDLELILDAGAKRLKPASRVAVQHGLDAIGAVLAILEDHYLGFTVARSRQDGRGAIAMLHRLREAQEAREARGRRIKAGQSTPDDLKALTDRRPI